MFIGPPSWSRQHMWQTALLPFERLFSRPQPLVSQQAKQRNVAESRSHAPDAPRTLVPTQSGQQLQQIDQRGVGCCWQAAVLGDAWTQETRSCARWIDQQ